MVGPDSCCPGALARSDAAKEAARARRWATERGQIDVLYPAGVPDVVIEAIDLADEVRAAWQTEGQRRLREEAERKAREG